MAGYAGLHEFLDALAARQPQALAAVDESGEWTYQQLVDASLRLAAYLRGEGVVGSGQRLPASWEAACNDVCAAPRPFYLQIPRGRLWYAICLAAWRLGLPLIALSDDMPDKAAERDRATTAAVSLRPVAAVVASTAAGATEHLPSDCTVFEVERLAAVLADSSPLPQASGEFCRPGLVTPESVLLYAYTGGTTKHSKCVATSHAMALWEMEHYSSILGGSIGPGDRVLQYSSAYWGAAAFGQLDIAMAFGACAVFVPVSPGVDWIASVIEKYQVSVLGTVPSQLRGVYPGGSSTRPSCLRTILTWGEKLPLQLSQPWRQHCAIFELLIATEYWLALHNNGDAVRDPVDGQEKPLLRALPALDFLLVKEDGAPASDGEVGELLLAGPTVSPGYVSVDGTLGASEQNAQAYTCIEGRRYFRTRDRLRRISKHEFVYCRRTDALVKRGGAWVDLEASEEAVGKLSGVGATAVVAAGAEEETGGLDVFVVLEAWKKPQLQGRESVRSVVDRARKTLGGAGTTAKFHIRSELKLHPATAKMDRRRLLADIEQVNAREAAHLGFLRSKQRRMLVSYASWCCTVVCNLLAPSAVLAWAGWLEGLVEVIFARLLLLPYMWAAIAYMVLDAHREKRLLYQPFGAQDYLLAVAAFMPACLLGCALPACLGMLAWGRDRDRASATAAAAFAGALFATRGAASESTSAWRPFANLGAAMVLASLGKPSRLRFFAALPMSFWLTAPKWFADDWRWRVRDHSFCIRRLLAVPLWPRIGEVLRPAWDATLNYLDSEGNAPPDINAWQEDANVAYVSYSDYQHGYAMHAEPTRKATAIATALNNVQSQNGHTKDAASGNGTSMAEIMASAPPAARRIIPQLAAIVRRVGGSPEALGAMDSLQAITLTEAVRKELGLRISVTQVLNCADVGQLAVAAAEAASVNCNGNRMCTTLSAASNSPGGANSQASLQSDDSQAVEAPDADGSFRVFTMHFPRHPVDWCVRYDGPEHLDLAALQRAVDRVVARHSALRTIQSPDEPLRDAMDRAASMWQLCVSGLCCDQPLGGSRRNGSAAGRCSMVRRTIGNALFECWPRTVVRPANAARPCIRTPRGPRVRDAGWEDMKDDRYVFHTVNEIAEPRSWPFEICLVPLYEGEPPEVLAAAAAGAKNAAEMAKALPRDKVSWYIYCSITHAYSDGASGQALYQDLCKFLAEEVAAGRGHNGADAMVSFTPIVQPSGVEAPEHLSVLQRRLKRSLYGRIRGENDPNNDVFHEIICEDWGKRKGYSRRLVIQPEITQFLRHAATKVLGCGIDVAWLTAVMGAVFRMFPTLPRHKLILKVPCRDGPEEAQMVGFLSEARIMTVDVGDLETATLADIAETISTTRRARSWRAPEPYEHGLCVYVNIVSSMGDGLPAGWQHVVKSASFSTRNYGDAYCHLNIRIDQVSANDWDVRIFHWDAALGWGWSGTFSKTLCEVMTDMVLSPAGPLLQEPGARGWCIKELLESAPTASRSGENKRKATVLEDAPEGQSPAKVPANGASKEEPWTASSNEAPKQPLVNGTASNGTHGSRMEPRQADISSRAEDEGIDGSTAKKRRAVQGDQL
eukprot:TRINITY_DN16694_c0_g1_i1.p1 TRINITY_DN16694_c0_g1~~TRINITY_DN16694_c0_g1_i1.p1  ORF type:complete len:1586 (-),score=297.51 TRINITY_DN16694_c0_g1_i1:44-4801(-)